MKKTALNLPDLNESYHDEFGPIDPEVYNAAHSIWPNAERLAAEIIYDVHLGMQLMMRAIARVSSARAAGTEIINLKFYLLRSYKNLLLAELEKENGRHRILAEHHNSQSISATESEESLNRKILINELRLEMDDWMREVFDLLVLGYAFEELVPEFGSASNVIRSKFSKRLVRLSKKLSSRL